VRKYPDTIVIAFPAGSMQQPPRSGWPGTVSRQEAAVQITAGPIDTTARARLLAVEVLLAEPELLGNDALEGDLYILRDELSARMRGPSR